MSVLANLERQIQDEFVRLSATTVTTLVDGKNAGTIIENIRVVNVGAGTPSVVIDMYDVANTTAYVISQAFPFAAAGSATGADVLQINQQRFLRAGWLLRATRTGGSANDLHCFALHGRPTGGRTP